MSESLKPSAYTQWHDTLAAAEDRVADFLTRCHKGLGPDARDRAAIGALIAELRALRSAQRPACGNGAGTTHYLGCECHESAWNAKLRRLRAELFDGVEELRRLREVEKAARALIAAHELTPETQPLGYDSIRKALGGSNG